MEWLEGVGLHTGVPSRVGLHRNAGPVRLRSAGVEASITELEVVSTARATTVQARGGALRVGTVEHALAALAGLGLYEGVTLEVEGPEMPLLDGGAGAWCAALQRLDLPPSAPRLCVARAASFDVGPSHYELAPADGAVEVTVRVDFDDPRLSPEASWTGDAADFVARIAPARTFALAREIDELARRGLALHVGRPFTADEPARHKLLDLLGDLYLRGGPPVGRVLAFRPGHAANARFLQRAVEDGVLTPIAGTAASPRAP